MDERTAAEILAELDPERVLRIATPEEGTALRISAVAAIAQAQALGRIASVAEAWAVSTGFYEAPALKEEDRTRAVEEGVRIVERLMFDLAEAGEYLDGIEDDSGVVAGWRKTREEARAWLILQGWQPGPEDWGA